MRFFLRLVSRPWFFPLLVGLALRLAYLALFPQRMPSNDDLFYWETAQSLIAGEGYVFRGEPATAWTPGFPLLLSGVVFLCGPSLLAARMFLVLFSAATIPLVMRMTGRWFDERVARVTGWVFALFPPFWFYGSALLSETPSIFFVVLLLELAGGLRERFSWRRSLALGLCYAALIYLKPELALLGPLYAVAAFLRPGSLPRRSIVAMGFIGGLSLLPWTYRNYLLFEEFIPLKTTGGKLIWWASHHPPLVQEPRDPAIRAKEKLLLVPGKPGETSENYSAEGIRRIKEDPLSYLVECFSVRAKGLFLGSQAEAAPHLSRSFDDLYLSKEVVLLSVKIFLFLGQGALSLLGIAGLFFLRDKERRRTLARYHFFGNTAVYLALLGITRYSMILMPILIPHAAALTLLLLGRGFGMTDAKGPVLSTPSSSCREARSG